MPSDTPLQRYQGLGGSLLPRTKMKKPNKASFDSTLDATRGGKEPLAGTEAEEIFKEMKRREF